MPDGKMALIFEELEIAVFSTAKFGDNSLVEFVDFLFVSFRNGVIHGTPELLSMLQEVIATSAEDYLAYLSFPLCSYLPKNSVR